MSKNPSPSLSLYVLNCSISLLMKFGSSFGSTPGNKSASQDKRVKFSFKLGSQRQFTSKYTNNQIRNLGK